MNTWHHLMTETGLGTTLPLIALCVAVAVAIREAGKR